MIRQVELIKKKKFTTIALNLKHEVFVVYIITLSINLGNEMHSLKRALIAYLKADEALNKVISKYVDFVDIFSPKLAAKLPKHIRINNHIIELVDD